MSSPFEDRSSANNTIFELKNEKKKKFQANDNFTS